VVGAGVVGCSVAAHLLQRAPRLKVAVLDRFRSAGMGSTSRAAGGVRAQFGTQINVALSLASIRELETIADTVEFRQHGYLFATATERGREYLDLVEPIQRKLGVPVERLNRAEVAEKVPFMETEDLVAASFSATDGYLDPYSVCSHYEKFSRRAGATFVLGRAVTRVDESGVELQDGERVTANSVVCAAGHWSAALLDLPVVRERHHLVLSGPIDGVPQDLGMVVDLDSGFHFRPEGRGLLAGFSDPSSLESEAGADESPPFDPSFIEHIAEVALPRLPALGDAGFDLRRSWAGWYAVTPDHHAIIGRVRDVVVATGFGGHGVMHAPAAGQAVADLVIDGGCSRFDLEPLRPERFAEGALTVEPMVI
jgi:sarcosine oxidase subunit beta